MLVDLQIYSNPDYLKVMYLKKRFRATEIMAIFLAIIAILAFKNSIVGPGITAPTAIGPFLNGKLPAQSPSEPSEDGYNVVPAFPNLSFMDVTVIASHSSTERMYVGQRNGLIYSFENNSNTSAKEVFLDLRGTSTIPWDGGLINLVFHPEFGNSQSPNRGYVYLFYNGNHNGEKAVKLVRYTVPDGSNSADVNSELLILSIWQRSFTHYGGGMAFGDDGFLYVAIGDNRNAPRHTDPQDIEVNLYGKVLRIDVDKDPTKSHAPPKILNTGHVSESTGVHYFIPNDNPYVGQTNVFEEIYSFGHRAPHRMTYDEVTDRFWIAEVGWTTIEEVNILVERGNYQWPANEGTLFWGNQQLRDEAPEMTFPLIGPEQPPVWETTRGSGRQAIIGGHVYRGSQFPELVGKYICGMHGDGRIWALTYDNLSNKADGPVVSNYTPGSLCAFGEDPNGEFYMGGLGEGTIYKLESASGISYEAPGLLSEVMAFSDLETMTTIPGLIPYELNMPFWSDGAQKYRWMAIPNDGTHDTPDEKITFKENGNWSFPKGSVFVKHFEIETSPDEFRKLETRFVVHGQDGIYYALTYKWRSDQTDADLLTEGESEDITTIFGTQTWRYPSKLECMNCHNPGAGYVLGPSTHQLNGVTTYPQSGLAANQLITLNHLEMFDQNLDPVAIHSMIKAPKMEEVYRPIGDRARAWLDANCSYCHNPASGTPGIFDLRYTTPLAQQGLINGEVSNDLGISGAKTIVPNDISKSIIYQRANNVGASYAMPPLAKDRVDSEGTALIAEWINSINTSPFVSSTLEDGLIVWLKMDENNGNMVFDETVYQNNGALLNGTSWGTGKFGSGLQLDGNNDQVSIDHQNSHNITEGLTLAAWIKVNDFDGWDGVITKGTSASPYAMQLWKSGNSQEPGKLRFTVNWGQVTGGNGGSSWNSHTNLKTGEWYHVAITYDGSSVKFYINGQVDSNQPNRSIEFGTTNQPIVLGADLPGNNEYFDGVMDEIRIYERALNAQEMNLLYLNNIVPLPCNAGTAAIGDACNDNNPNTINDIYDSYCNCVGTLQINIRVMLQGPFQVGGGLMSDQLRQQNLIPLLDPYGLGACITNPSVLLDYAENSIVDWVTVTLFDMDQNPIFTRSALLQRDGDVVEIDGVSPITFPDVSPANYYVSVGHRNHLNIMTKSLVDLSN